MPKCPHPEKKHHATKRAALDQLGESRRSTNHRGGGHSLKGLEVYLCQCRFGWCIGHSKNRKTVIAKKSPAPKIPTTGELKRRLRKLEQQWDRQNRHRAYLLQKVVEADCEMLAAEEERTQLIEQMRAEQTRVLAELGIIP